MLLIGVGAIALYTLVGFFVVPPVLKAQLEKRLSAELGRTTTVGKVRCNPYTLSLTFADFDIRLKDGQGSLLGWSRLFVRVDALASLTGDWVLGQIDLDGLRANLAIQADGSLSVSDILAKLNSDPAKPATKPGRPIRTRSLKVSNARVEFADLSRAKPFATVVGPLTFALTEFRTVGARGAPYQFEAVTEAGEKLAWTGTISAEPFRSQGQLGLENIILAKYAPYYADRMQADLIEGKLSVQGQYEINLTAGQRALKWIDGAVQLRGIKVRDRASQELAVELEALEVKGIDADGLAQKANVGSVKISGGHVVARREKNGAINLVKMFLPLPTATAALPTTATAALPVAASPAPSTSGATKMPDVTIAEVALENFRVEVSDLSPARPTQMGLSGIQLSVKNVSLADGAAMPLQLAFEWAPHGTVRIAGTASARPELKAELQIDVKDLALLPLGPYLENFTTARLAQGTVVMNLTAQLALPAGQPPVATIAGEVALEKLAVVDGVRQEELAGMESLVLKGLKISSARQLSIALDEVHLTAPYARVQMNSDKTLNLASMVPVAAPPGGESTVRAASPVVAAATPPAAPTTPSAPTATAATTASSATPAPTINIGQVVLSKGDFSFADRSVEPNVRLALNEFAGTVTGLSSEPAAKGNVDLRAMVDGAGPITIRGQLAPLTTNLFADLKIELRSMDLVPLSPYSGKYAGYELARGKLVLDVKLRLDGKKIEAANVITLNQFTFGSAVPSAEATKLPVRLGVALLKDGDGKIVIDVPIQGSTDDPSFQVGKVVGRVVGNLLTKVATSPFSLLGSMFGGGGEELSYQEFAAGAATLQPGEAKKLDTVVKALAQRTGLSVELAGSYDGAADSFALKQQKLADLVRRAQAEKHATGPNVSANGPLVITAPEHAAILKQLFVEKFPPGTKFSAPVTKAPAAMAQPVPPRSFVGRMVDVITFKGRRIPETKVVELTKPMENLSDEPAPGLSQEEMAGRLAEAMEVGDDELRTLAVARAQMVRDYFINEGKIAPERLLLVKEKPDQPNVGKGSRVTLALQ